MSSNIVRSLNDFIDNEILPRRTSLIRELAAPSLGVF